MFHSIYIQCWGNLHQVCQLLCLHSYQERTRKTMLLLINNIHNKIMQNLHHMQNNLFTSDCQYLHNEKNYLLEQQK